MRVDTVSREVSAVSRDATAESQAHRLSPTILQYLVVFKSLLITPERTKLRFALVRALARQYCV